MKTHLISVRKRRSVPKIRTQKSGRTYEWSDEMYVLYGTCIAIYHIKCSDITPKLIIMTKKLRNQSIPKLYEGGSPDRI